MLYEKIIAIYPELAPTQDANGNIVSNQAFKNLTIMLQNDNDDKGDYIAKWEHPTLARPTQDQLSAVG
jgi:hypothetical protein